MDKLTGDEIVRLFLAIATILVAARVLGEVARRLSQPVVLGEILAGILLGPTVFGTILPGGKEFLFPNHGSIALAQDAFRTLSIALFLLVAGMEVELSTMWKQGRAALSVGLMGIALPFVLGFGAARVAPDLLGATAGVSPETFALFFATALSISALPVIAKTLMDLHIYKSDFGMTVIAAAVFNDLVGWLVFAVILGQIEYGTSSASHMPIGLTLAVTAGFAVLMLTAVRWLIHRTLPWILAHASFPTGVIGFALALALAGAAFTEFIGIHAIFGSFLVGVALGDSAHLRERTRTTITEFVSSIFAPLFFGSIGLSVNFITNFDPALCGFVLLIACLGKVVGCGLGARWAKMSWRESWAVGFGMNARGAMEIILGLLALQYGLIQEPMFVALVVMSLVTSMASGPVIERLLRRTRPRRIEHFIHSRTFLPRMRAIDRKSAIDELCQTLARASGLDYARISTAVWEREQVTSTGIGDGLAVPHARIDGLTQPYVAMGLSSTGVDFDSLDGKPAQLVFVILTPPNDNGVQLEILADIGRTFVQPNVRDRALKLKSFTELLALLRTEPVAA
ncbi:MAG: cation:proton antiporter [Planctomycetes bacterium]|nr:cation:proton antiporter [Planctomycetota bacterium]